MSEGPGFPLSGNTSDRIRAGDIKPDMLPKGRDPGEIPPSIEAIKNAEGHGLGRGWTRNGDGMAGDARSTHFESVETAIRAIGELQEVLRLASERAENAQVYVQMATGLSSVPAADSARAFTAETHNRLEELFRITERIAEELRAYSSQF